MMQIRGSDGRAFNFSRDIVQLFPRVIGYHAAVRLSALKWPPMIKKYAESMGLTDKDLASAERPLALFVTLASKAGVDDFNTIFVQSGLDKLKPPVLLALMAVIGEVTCGVFFKTIRASIPAGHSVPGASQLGEIAEMSAYAMAAELPHVAAKRQVAAEQAALPSILDNDPTSTP